MTDTVNRGWLLRQAQAGKLEGRLDHYIESDGPGYEVGQPTDPWLPVIIGGYEDYGREGVLVLCDYEFRGKSGYASRNRNGEITFSVHSNLCYTLRQAHSPANK